MFYILKMALARKYGEHGVRFSSTYIFFHRYYTDANHEIISCRHFYVVVL